jgi:hypothetical protein
VELTGLGRDGTNDAHDEMQNRALDFATRTLGLRFTRQVRVQATLPRGLQYETSMDLPDEV